MPSHSHTHWYCSPPPASDAKCIVSTQGHYSCVCEVRIGRSATDWGARRLTRAMREGYADFGNGCELNSCQM